MSEDLVAKALRALRDKNYSDARACIIIYGADHSLELQHFLIRGLCDIALSDWEAARLTFEEATSVYPHQAQLWLNLGVALENCGALDDAAESYEHCLELDPKQADASGNLSNIYRHQGRYMAAEDMAHSAFELGANKVQSLNSLGLAVAKQGRFDAADAIFKQALELDPTNPLVCANRANLAVDQLHFEAAWPLFAAARAVSDTPLLRRDEGMARLLAGDYEAGWKLYEARTELPDALRHTPIAPRWQGQVLIGKSILLVTEQGFGDTLQFCRFGDELTRAGADVSWYVRQPLKKLLEANVKGHVFSDSDMLPLTDYWAPLMSLPLLLAQMTPSDAPRAPYLKAPAEPKLLAPGQGKKIALVWSGSETHERDHERSLPLDAFESLWQKSHSQFYAPFTGSGLGQITSKTPVTDLSKFIHDFADTAALLMQCDCLVTVDTAAAHLAGALGLPTYLLLPFCPDWRWGTTGTTTPWYPSVTLLRQPRYGDWDSPLGELAQKLKS